MSGFSSAWLALREPYDLRARNRAVLDAVARAFADRETITVVDLACGTGSTYRALSPHLPVGQNWCLVDNDPALLANIAPAPNVTLLERDIARGLDGLLGGNVDLVATSALLDLTSEDWIEALVRAASGRNLPFYAALSYDGRVRFDPPDATDDAIIAAVDRHQCTDKGFGPALGPRAVQYAIERFERAGYAVVRGDSDWQFGPQDRDIQMETLSGWAEAAREIGDMPSARIDEWLARRLSWVEGGRSTIGVGHADFFARPTGTR